MSGTLPTLKTGVLLPFCAGFFHAVFVHQKNWSSSISPETRALCPKKMGVAISPGGAFFVYSAGIDHTVFVHLLNGISFHSHQVFCVINTPCKFLHCTKKIGIEPSDLYRGYTTQGSIPKSFGSLRGGICFNDMIALLIRLEIGSSPLWGQTRQIKFSSAKTCACPYVTAG